MCLWAHGVSAFERTRDDGILPVKGSKLRQMVFLAKVDALMLAMGGPILGVFLRWHAPHRPPLLPESVDVVASGLPPGFVSEAAGKLGSRDRFQPGAARVSFLWEVPRYD